MKDMHIAYYEKERWLLFSVFHFFKENILISLILAPQGSSGPFLAAHWGKGSKGNMEAWAVKFLEVEKYLPGKKIMGQEGGALANLWNLRRINSPKSSLSLVLLLALALSLLLLDLHSPLHSPVLSPWPCRFHTQDAGLYFDREQKLWAGYAKDKIGLFPWWDRHKWDFGGNPP